MRKLLSKVKYDKVNLDLEEFDDKWLENEPKEFDTDLKIPENFNLNDFIMPA
jgi:hypothetical protein